MPTYVQIIDWVRENRGIIIGHKCYVAHCKAISLGYPNPDLTKKGSPRVVPCPDGAVRVAIFDAFAELGVPNGRRN